MKIKEMNALLFGNPKIVRFETRLLNIVIFSGAVIFFTAIIVNIKVDILLVIATSVFFILTLWGYYFSRIKKNFKFASILQFLICWVTVIYLWITNAGSYGSMPYFLPVLMVIMALVYRRKPRLIALSLLILTGLIMYTLEYFELISISAYQSPGLRFYDNIFNMVVSSLLGVLIMILFKKGI